MTGQFFSGAIDAVLPSRFTADFNEYIRSHECLDGSTQAFIMIHHRGEVQVPTAGLDPKDPSPCVVPGFFDAGAPAGPTRGVADSPLQFYVPKGGYRLPVNSSCPAARAASSCAKRAAYTPGRGRPERCAGRPPPWAQFGPGGPRRQGGPPGWHTRASRSRLQPRNLMPARVPLLAPWLQPGGKGAAGPSSRFSTALRDG